MVLKKTKRKIIQIKLSDKIKYKPITQRLGRAEFVICPIFKYGYLREIFIYRVQQETSEIYHLDLEKELNGSRINVFHITSWTHKRDEPSIWQNFWCKKHKTISFEIYVPNNTNMIEFDFHFGNDLTIRFA